MQKGGVKADGSSINKEEREDKSKSISTFRHFDISTSRSALNYFSKNNFNNDQNAILKCRNMAFNHIIGLPKKNEEDKPFYDCEKLTL